MTKAAARFAAAYGTIICPAGLSQSETITGLMINIPHIRAREIVGIAIAAGAGSAAGLPGEILDIAAESKAERFKMRADQWRASGMDRLQGLSGG